MYNGLLHAHSGLRWILLLLLVITIINGIKKCRGKEKYTDLDNKLSLFTLIFAHTQLLIGIILLFISEKNILENFSMGNKIYRFFGVEHTLGMLIAIVLITVGRIQAKKMSTDEQKHRKTFIFFLIALLLILISIPWPFRGFGTGLF